MPIVGRKLYIQAMEEILIQTGYKYKKVKIERTDAFIVHKNGRRIYIGIAGKNLPYFSKNGQQVFPWETWMDPYRLDAIEKRSGKFEAESWIGFCYALFEKSYENFFRPIVSINGISFGTKLIRVEDYKANMEPRSEDSWNAVYLPKKLVLTLTCDPESI